MHDLAVRQRISHGNKDGARMRFLEEEGEARELGRVEDDSAVGEVNFGTRVRVKGGRPPVVAAKEGLRRC